LAETIPFIAHICIPNASKSLAAGTAPDHAWGACPLQTSQSAREGKDEVKERERGLLHWMYTPL